MRKMFCSLRARRWTLAHANKDHDLAALVEVTPTSLDRLGEQELSIARQPCWPGNGGRGRAGSAFR